MRDECGLYRQMIVPRVLPEVGHYAMDGCPHRYCTDHIVSFRNILSVPYDLKIQSCSTL